MVGAFTGLQLFFIGGLIGLIYTTRVMGQFFEGKFMRYFKSLIAYMPGFVFFSFSAAILGAVIDIIIGK